MKSPSKRPARRMKWLQPESCFIPNCSIAVLAVAAAFGVDLDAAVVASFAALAWRVNATAMGAKPFSPRELIDGREPAKS